jgi:hypothetical protein
MQYTALILIAADAQLPAACHCFHSELNFAQSAFLRNGVALEAG